jgi:restriction system protein
MMVTGALLLLLPLLVHEPIGSAFRPVRPVAAFLVLLGVASLWWQWRTTRVVAWPQPKGEPRPTLSSDRRAAVQTESAAASIADTPEAIRHFSAQRTNGMPSSETPLHWSPRVFELIEWRRFEAVVEALFGQAGFVTKSQSHGADGGVDVWLYSKHQVDGKPVSVVQCKHWQGKRVGVDKVRELRGVMAAHDVQRGQFATTSDFTDEAEAFARDNGIHLLNVRALLTLIGQRTAEQQQDLLSVAFQGEYWRPTCASCGVKMVERRAKSTGGAFWGCVSYPKCRNVLPMRERRGP